MKRVVYQIIFLLFYVAINIYLNFYWLQDVTGRKSSGNILPKVALGSLLYIIPFIILGYYLALFALHRIVNNKSNLLVNIAVIIIPYAIAIEIAVVIMRFIVFPYLFHYDVPAENPLLDGRHFFGIMIQAAFPAFFLMADSFVKKQNEANEREKNLIKEKLTTELQLLKNQLNPHFLFNTLNNIYALSRKKSDLAPDVIMKLSELLSFMLYETGSGTITIEKEIKFLEDYIYLQKLRFADNLALSFKKSIDNPAQSIAPLLLLPLIENAFKHGAGENHFDSFININLQLKKEQLYFTVENSFEALTQNNQQSNIGLHNTSRQLELLYSEQNLETSNTNKIFKVQLSINLNSYGKI
ncbi:MAG: histidine kinase [Chitinophagaceae bacterium]|nr:histidine kinase [Chitinophagaceae bacterium]